ncbi:MAG: hypothetical protein P4L71_02785 [Acetobacteraceae bacterium]|nr:hypothetical protein [Acetobacteraceae bacterium]
MGDPDETPASKLIRQLEQLSPRLGHRFVADPAKAAVFDAAAARVQAQADAVVGGTRMAAGRSG